MRGGPNGSQNVCENCYEATKQLVEALDGNAPRYCQVCKRTNDEANESTPGVEVRMYVHRKDGILQFLCERCSAEYVLKRADQFKGTAFGNKIL